MIRRFYCCVSAVRWGNALSSSFFTIFAGVRQGGLLSLLLFAVDLDSGCAYHLLHADPDLDVNYYNNTLSACR